MHVLLSPCMMLKIGNSILDSYAFFSLKKKEKKEDKIITSTRI